MGTNYRGYQHVQAEGVQWCHLGMSYIVYRHFDYARCNCEYTAFDMDFFDRMFIPDALRFSVEIIDKEKNTLLRLGRYGTWADADDKESSAKQEPELGWVTCVRVADNVCLIGDHINHRLWKVHLGYAFKADAEIKVDKHE
jgi:hypothetical protein